MNRLLKAGVAPEIRRAMDVEDEILSEIEKRDTIIMQKDEEIVKKDEELGKKDEELGKRDEELGKKDEIIREAVRMLKQAGLPVDEIARKFSLSPESVNHLLNE